MSKIVSDESIAEVEALERFDARKRDEELEDKITIALMTWQHAKGPWKIRNAYNEFNRLVALRSPRQVRKLEEEKGLV